MANWINKTAGTIAEKYNSAVASVDSHFTTGPISKLWRARILTNRLASGLPKASSVTPNFSATIQSVKNLGSTISTYAQEIAGVKAGPSSAAVKLDREEHNQLNSQSGQIRQYGGMNKWVTSRANLPRIKDNLATSDNNDIVYYPTVTSIETKAAWESVKREWQQTRAQNYVIIYNTMTSPSQSVVLQNRPSSIEIDPKTNWATIKSMGRNTPMYHYTGAEDTITMNISWYCDDTQNSDPENIDPEQVFSKCKVLEAWSKADGYTKAPPVLSIQWGSSNLFKNEFFILASAKYTLNHFNAFARSFNRESNTQNLYNYKLYPFSATQELVFKRISSYNLTTNDFISEERLKALNIQT